MKRKFMNVFSNCKNILCNIRIMLSYIHNESGGNKYFALKLLQSLTAALIPLGMMTFPGLLINTLIQNELDQRKCIVYVLLILVLPVLNYFINLVLNYELKKTKQQIELKIVVNYYKHVLKMDYELYDRPDVQINKTRSLTAISKAWNVSDILFGFVSQVIGLVAIISIISILNPFLTIVATVFSILFSIIRSKANKKLFSLDQKGSEIDRRMWGVTYMLEQKDYAKEIRLFHMHDLLLGEYEKTKQESLSLNMEYFKTQSVPSNFNAIFDLTQNVLIYGYLIFNVIKLAMPIGNFTIYLSCYNKFKGNLNGLINSFLELAKISLNVDELNRFMNLTSETRPSENLPVDYSNGSVIEFRNVSFKYPGSDLYALKDVNISINFNEKLCIVGENGAGKSTFIKLLTRLYSPTEGLILLNGKDITQYDIKEYMKLFAPVFQDFVKYYFSLGINIALTTNYDIDKLDHIVYQCHLEQLIRKLPKGYNTQVGKWIDSEGFEPSGGENQRIAIARALYKGGDIYILDEPTAALDPNSEYEIYKQFSNMTKDKTAILVTHRLSAVQLADKVAVFEGGQIVEYGTHAELYAMDGIYTEMFDKQAQFYRDAPDVAG